MSRPLSRWICVALIGLAGAAGAADDDAAGRRAGDACEAAVASAVREARGRAATDIRFVGGQRALSPGAGEDTGVKGEGRYQGTSGAAVAFSYTCAFSPSSGATHGVLFSERGGAAATAPAAQPDLARLSPAACEAATAAALKTKHPRVDRITFGSDSRELTAVPEARTALEGRGALARAPGMNAVPFSYRCEFDNRSGRVVAVRTSD